MIEFVEFAFNSNNLASNSKGDLSAVSVLNVVTLGLKSIMSEFLTPLIVAMSLLYLSLPYESTDTKSPSEDEDMLYAL